MLENIQPPNELQLYYYYRGINIWELTLNEEITYQPIENSFLAIRNMREGPASKYIQYKIEENRFCPHCEE